MSLSMASNHDAEDTNPFWDEIPDELSDVMTKSNDTSRKNAVIGGLFYLMAFVMFFTELRILSLLHCVFGTMFMFFYKIGIQAGDE